MVTLENLRRELQGLVGNGLDFKMNLA